MKKPVIPSLPVTRDVRARLGLPDDRYDKRGRLRVASPREAREVAMRLAELQGGTPPPASDIYGAAYIVTAWRLLLDEFGTGPDPFEPGAVDELGDDTRGFGTDDRDSFLTDIAVVIADDAVWHGRRTPREAALREAQDREGLRRLSGRERTVRNWTLARLASEDPAFAPFRILFGSTDTTYGKRAAAAAEILDSHDRQRPAREPEDAAPLETLRKPVQAAPDSVKDQLLYILTRWGRILGDWAVGLVGALDMIEEETRPRFGGGPGPVRRPGLDDLDGEARFSRDHDWMPRVVMVAKNVLVWMDQLAKSYDREIRRLDQIPDEELDLLAARGFNALWLIGLWERSAASREMKQRMGNPEAAASAYSLFGYDIDPELGGWEALDNLRRRAGERGVRLSSDMVPNHVGIDSDWVRQHPEWLLSADHCPYPAYGWGSDNLSGDPNVDIRLEDHYWDRSDAAVVFRRVDNNSGDTKYIYHGNDGTSMPWNDTAQIDFANPEAREAVVRDILHVARNFPIIRFDAAMVLARKSIRRLWYPAPGAGGAIPSRSECALTDEQFDEAIPTEFWRDVVDRVAAEIPGTLLLAEAFWMMEGYFVRSLGMHRVYNSAFMNMLRDGKNSEYRAMMKETLAFDPGILQRYVNFMNNPDEETAVDQFGKDDRYFAVATLLATLPGLPMFGHGQVEGLSEKYGMEYVKAYRDEHPDSGLIARHEREIFPLLHRRSLFAGATGFRLYDLENGNGVNENVFAHSNSDHSGPALVIVNNAYESVDGRIHRASPVKNGETVVSETLADAIVPHGMGDGDWILLREGISELWYLRSAGELRSGGLSVSISGYGRQVYMDFRLETETPDGLWGRLAAELGGSGVPDPDAAIQELRLRPVHSALDALLSRDWIAAAAADLARGRTPVWGDRSDGISSLIRAHAEVSANKSNADPDAVNSKILRMLAGASRYRRLIGGGSRSLRRTADRLFPEESGSGDEIILVLRAVLGTLTVEVCGPGAKDSCGFWGLDIWFRKRDICSLADFAVPRFSAAVSGMEFLGPDSAVGDAWKALSAVMADPGFRDACGVNAWDGVLWFGADEWTRSARAAILAAGCSNPGLFSGFAYRRKMRRLMRRWQSAAAASEYKVDELLRVDGPRNRK